MVNEKTKGFSTFLYNRFWHEHAVGTCKNPVRVGLSGYSIILLFPLVGHIALLCLYIEYLFKKPE